MEVSTSRYQGHAPKTLQSVCTLTVVVSPDPLSPTPSPSSALKTPGPSASLVETKTHQKAESDPDALQPAAAGDIRMEYLFDWLCSTNIGAVTKFTIRTEINIGTVR